MEVTRPCRVRSVFLPVWNQPVSVIFEPAHSSCSMSLKHHGSSAPSGAFHAIATGLKTHRRNLVILFQQKGRRPRFLLAASRNLRTYGNLLHVLQIRDLAFHPRQFFGDTVLWANHKTNLPRLSIGIFKFTSHPHSSSIWRNERKS